LSAEVTDRAKLRQAIESVAGQIAAMIKDLPDTNVPIPKTEWTVGEAAAHMSDAQRLFSRLAAGEQVIHGDGTIASLEQANRGALVANTERNGATLAASIVDHTQSFLRLASAMPPTRAVDTPMGRMDTETMYTYMLTHLLSHGFQIGLALNQSLVVDRSGAELTLPFIKYSLPMIVDKKAAGKLKAIYQVQLRGGPRFWVKLDRGTATVHEQRPGRVDCFISADPVSFLQVGFRLKSQWPLIARGKLFAWGLKPWLGFRFAGLFLPP
jgi:uncharacterized damage-inducible protein DinB